jgi:hypothetical protein
MNTMLQQVRQMQAEMAKAREELATEEEDHLPDEVHLRRTGGRGDPMSAG